MSRLLAYLLACSFACLFIFIDFLFVYPLSPWASPTAAVHKPRLFRRSVSSPYFPPRNRRRKKTYYGLRYHLLYATITDYIYFVQFPARLYPFFLFFFSFVESYLSTTRKKENGGVILANSRARRRKKVNSVSLLVLEQEKGTCISSRLGR